MPFESDDSSSVLVRMFNELTACSRSLLMKKNADYASQSPLSNVMMCASIGVDPKLGILVRMMDKIGRMATLCRKRPEVSSESFKDTLVDVVGYAVLLYALYKVDTYKRLIAAVCRVLQVPEPCTLSEHEVLQIGALFDREAQKLDDDSLDDRYRDIVNTYFNGSVSVAELKQAVQHVVRTVGSVD